jgi:hypothetical protein
MSVAQVPQPPKHFSPIALTDAGTQSEVRYAKNTFLSSRRMLAPGANDICFGGLLASQQWYPKRSTVPGTTASPRKTGKVTFPRNRAKDRQTP